MKVIDRCAFVIRAFINLTVLHAKEKEYNINSKYAKLDNFLISASSSSCASASSSNASELEQILGVKINPHEKKTVSDTSINKDTLSKEKESENENEETKFIRNDFAHNVGTPIDADLREQILKLGPCQPEGNFQKDAKGRSLSSTYYSFISKAGQKIERKWLCYSTRLHVAYCQVCWLFADRTNVYFKEAWCKGVNDWKKLLVWLKSGVSPRSLKKRDRKVRQFFDDFNADEKLQDRERLFEMDVFKVNVDVITTQLKNRFESMNGIYKSFSFLSPKNIVSSTNDLLYNEVSNRQKVCSLDLPSEYSNPIMSLKAVFSEDLIKLNSTKDLGNFLRIQNKFAAPGLPDVCIEVFLFLTLPVSAMSERSFSKLKLIKNYLRCTMSEERLSYLSLISIQQQEARKFELDELITDFTKKNVRRQSLFTS
ncbi:uncharacterized protein TNCV_1945611 [Trichonephila clavipes]|nr:uncharacterized protein TNCV_1945611 [Trichonephila clavipes]